MALAPYLRTTLHILPLMSSTASLTHAYMEALTTDAFLHPAPTTSALTRALAKETASSLPSTTKTEAAKDLLIPIWFTNFFHAAVYSVITFNTLTTTSAAANLYLYPNELGSTGSRTYYAAGLTAALAHFAFVPAVAGSIERLFKMCVAQAKGQVVQGGAAANTLREWNARHRVRMMTVDLCAWVCFSVGVVGFLTP